LQLVSDPKTMIDRITTKDPAALPPLVTRVIQLKYASTSNMVDSVQGTLTDKRSRVVADNRTSQLVVVATDPEQRAVDTLINQLDTPTRQVLIETRLVEISSNPTSKKGINWSGTLAAQNIAFGNNALPSLPPQAASTVPTPGGGSTIVPATQGTIGGILGAPGLLGSTTGPFFNPATGFLNADGAHAVLSF
jgi:type II secretory pathway component GspD/PulD (secretin)